VSEVKYLFHFYGWSDEFNLFRINHKPSPIFAAAVEIGKDHRGLKQVCGQREKKDEKTDSRNEKERVRS